MSRICAKNLPKYVDDDRLQEVFSQKGEITDAKLMRTKDGKSRQFAFIGFRTEHEAQEAIKYFNKSSLDTCRIACEKKGDPCMDEVKETLRTNRLEDVSWLCCLSESELDFLVSLKMLILQRAKIIGHDELAKKFDLKMLRALGLILMEHFRVKVKDLSLTPGLADSDAFVDGCKLLKCNVENVMSIEEIMGLISNNSRKRPAKRPREDDLS